MIYREELETDKFVIAAAEFILFPVDELVLVETCQLIARLPHDVLT